jgi:hypothetical protein
MTRNDIDWEWVAREYTEGLSAVQLASVHHVPSSVIYSHLQKMGIARRPLTEAKRRYAFNERYFQSLDSPEICYWLGFLFADGSISEVSNALRINLKAADASHLQHFLSDLEATSHQVKYKIVSGHKVAGIAITSKYLRQDLAFWGMTMPKKERQLPQVPQPLLHHFVRGYFDGDGSISVNRTEKGELWKASIVALSRTLLEQIAETLIKVPILCSVYSPANTHLCYLAVGRNQVRRFGQWLYADASRFMARKRERFEQII